MTGYMYDADGIRVSKGTIQVWSCNPATAQYATTADYILGPGGEQMSEYRMQPGGTMAWDHTNVWVAGRLLATYSQNTTTVNGTTTLGSLVHFYLDDPLGTRRAQADYAGNLEQTCSSLPYGDSESCGPTPTEHLFTGKERDSESGNDYFGARYYASSMGRWLSPDWSANVEPVPYSKLDDPQTLNLYAYVTNNPLTRADADGHATWYDPKGHKLGSDGINDGGVVVQKASEVSYSPDHSLIDVANSGIPMYSFTQAEGNAIQASVDRTLAPAGGDHQGGFHEEGFTEDASIHVAAPGPAYQQGESTAHINQTITDSTTLVEHTHPVGTQNSAGSTTFGGTQFDPKPSTGPGQDVPNAAGSPTNRNFQPITYVEASAGTKRVYVYNGNGVQADLPLSAFPRQ